VNSFCIKTDGMNFESLINRTKKLYLYETKTRNFISLAILALIFTVSACKKSDSGSNNQPSSMNIYLTDAPADYKAVWIDIEQVMVKGNSDSSGNDGWVSVPLLRAGKYNLLDLRNGKDTLLGGVDLPAGKVSQIRLILGESNQLVLNDGTTVDLKTPSGQESGIKLDVDADLKAGIPYELVLDFDAARSIVKAGNSGQYILKPVIRTFAKAAGGGIQGVVLPDSANAHVMAISGADTLGAIPDASGSYQFWGVPEGSYNLIFSADSTTGYKSDTLNNIAVTVGNITTADTVRLVQ
jgi:hypothetical protein